MLHRHWVTNGTYGSWLLRRMSRPRKVVWPEAKVSKRRERRRRWLSVSACRPFIFQTSSEKQSNILFQHPSCTYFSLAETKTTMQCCSVLCSSYRPSMHQVSTPFVTSFFQMDEEYKRIAAQRYLEARRRAAEAVQQSRTAAASSSSSSSGSLTPKEKQQPPSSNAPAPVSAPAPRRPSAPALRPASSSSAASSSSSAPAPSVDADRELAMKLQEEFYRQ